MKGEGGKKVTRGRTHFKEHERMSTGATTTSTHFKIQTSRYKFDPPAPTRGVGYIEGPPGVMAAPHTHTKRRVGFTAPCVSQVVTQASLT